MKRAPALYIITIFTVIMLSILSQPVIAQAKSSALVATSLTIQTAESAQIGSSNAVLIQLSSTKGEPISDQLVEFFVNGAQERRARTNAEGKITLKFQREVVGTYTLLAVYKGSKSPTILASKATAQVVVVPAKIEIHITPPLANIRFSVDNQIFSSNSEGIASLEMEKTGKFSLELLTTKTEDKDIKIEFSRWGDDTFVSQRDIEVPLVQPLDAGFEVSYQVSQTFVDLAGQPVDPARITSVTIKGSNGTTYTFSDNQPHWLLAGRVIRLSNGLEQTRILYSVIDVTIDGSNVVSQAQQRFYAEPNDVWPLKLLLYSANFTARDALFRFPIGSGIQMEYPNGEIKTFKFGSSNKYSSEGLARGIYHVTVTGVRGIAPPTPIALSRDQDVELIVLSYIDIGFMLAVGLSFALGLLFFGRPKILAYLAVIPNRMIALPRQWVTVHLPQVSSRISSFLKTRVFKKQTILPENNRGLLETPPQISENSLVESVAQQPVEPEISLQPANEIVPESVASIIPLEVQENELIEASPMPNPILEETIHEIPQLTSDVSPAVISEPKVLEPTNELSQTIVSEAKLTSLIHEIQSPIQTKIAYACRVCGSAQIVKDGSNRRGAQQYVCETCGTYNIFEAKRTGKSRRRKKATNLS